MGCPVSINIPAFIAQVKERNFEEAYHIISESSTTSARAAFPGGHDKGLAFCRPGRQGAQQGGDGGHHGDVGRQRTP